MAKTINGTAGNDILTGTNPGDPGNTDGVDQIYGGGGDDTLSGLGGNDRIEGGEGTDILNGGDGSDTLFGRAGADALNGGAGVDTVYYIDSAAGVTIDLRAGTGVGGEAHGDTLTGIENIYGSDTADILRGDAGANDINGRDGNDLIYGYGGADIFNGDSGTDTVSYDGSAAGVTVDLRTGTGTGGDAEGDRLTSIENIIGSALADTLIGDGENNNLTGGAGADVLNGGTGFDTVRYDGSAAGVTVDLRTGTGTGGDAEGDTLTGFEYVAGSAFADTLRGDGGANIIAGGAGNDQIAGYAGADLLNGGAGIDTIYYDTAAVFVNLATGQGSGGDAAGDTYQNVENVVGTALADRLTGSADANDLRGGGGDDTLRGGAGGDALDGGAGSDFANYQGSAAVTVNLLAGTASGGDAQGDTLTGIENLYGSSNNDQLTGNDVRNILGGELGEDTLVGNGGDDALSGEAGNDTLRGGDGADRLVGGAGIDTIHGGTGNDSVDAGSEADQVFGEAGHDAIYGGAGNDSLDGGDGNDTLEGSGGGDALIGGAGIDTAVYAGSTEAVSVNLATGVMSGGDAAGDTLSGIEQVMGSGFGDTLIGDGNANTLWGLAGDDVLTGGGGGDALKGGAGNDRFVYTAVSDSAVSGVGKDGITDFATGDKIDLSAIDADGNPANGDTTFSFGTGDFTGAGQLRVVTAGAIQVVYVDVNGDKAPDFAINVTSDHALTAADFVL